MSVYSLKYRVPYSAVSWWPLLTHFLGPSKCILPHVTVSDSWASQCEYDVTNLFLIPDFHTFSQQFKSQTISEFLVLRCQNLPYFVIQNKIVRTEKTGYTASELGPNWREKRRRKNGNVLCLYYDSVQDIQRKVMFTEPAPRLFQSISHHIGGSILIPLPGRRQKVTFTPLKKTEYTHNYHYSCHDG